MHLSFLLSLLLFLASIALLSSSSTAYNEELQWKSCSISDNYTDGSQYLANLELLLGSLIQNTANTGFFYFNDTAGQGADRVYGLAMCYAYDDKSYCQACVAQAAKEIVQLCPSSINATVWYWPCQLRYSNQDFFSVLDTSSEYYLYHNQTVNESNDFTYQLGQLMGPLITKASSSPLMFALDKINVTINDTLYGFVQCMRDLTNDECNQCLKSYEDELRKCCGQKDMTVLSGQSCHMVFALNPFYPTTALLFTYALVPAPAPAPVPVPGPVLAHQSPQLSPTPAIAHNSSSIDTASTPTANKKKGPIIAAISVSVSALLLLFAFGILLWRRKTHKNHKKLKNEDIKPYHSTSSIANSNRILQEGTGVVMYDFNTLRDATGNFSDENKLGEGGFGQVYKGSLPNGKEIAVKRLSRSSDQGITQLKNEIELLARLSHKNLVQLLGFCMGEDKKLLCYEYLPNGSLDKLLFEKGPTRRKELDWTTRYKIIEGISYGLLYLHEESRLKIIHRDLKASNILITGDMSPKISDFGLARLFDGDQTHQDTYNIAGTFGYMAPEYVLNGNFSAKSDVYSFGVLLLEIVTGQKNGSFSGPHRALCLTSSVWQHWKEGTVLQIKDPTIGDEYNEQVLRCIHIGLLCVQEDPINRPNMETVNLMLNSHSVSIPNLSSTSHIRPVLISMSEKERNEMEAHLLKSR